MITFFLFKTTKSQIVNSIFLNNQIPNNEFHFFSKQPNYFKSQIVDSVSGSSPNRPTERDWRDGRPGPGVEGRRDQEVSADGLHHQHQHLRSRHHQEQERDNIQKASKLNFF